MQPYYILNCLSISDLGCSIWLVRYLWLFSFYRVNNARSKQKQDDLRKLSFRQCFSIGNPTNARRFCTRKYKEGSEIWPESFQRIEGTFVIRSVSGHVHGKHRFHHFSLFTEHWQKWITHWQKHQMLFNEAPACRCARKHSLFPKVLCIYYNFRLFPSIFIWSKEENFDGRVNFFCKSTFD